MKQNNIDFIFWQKNITQDSNMQVKTKLGELPFTLCVTGSLRVGDPRGDVRALQRTKGG